MSTLNKYLIKQSFIPFVLSVGVITTVLFLQFLIRAIDRFLGKGLDVFTILEYLYLNLAWIIALSVPMSLLISSVMTYGRMSQENEITALKSAGVNLFSIIKPALWFGSIVGFLLCLFNNFILPDMNYNARLLARDIYQKKPELTIEPGYFVDMIPQYTMIVKELDGKEFKDIKIFSKNTSSEQTTIYAKSGSLESKGGIITVNLQDGEIHEIDLENYDHYRKIKFGTHQIIISIDDLLLNRTSESNRTDREMKVPAMIEKIQQNKISIEQIKKRIETVKNDIGIDTNSQMNLAGIMNQIEILKEDTSVEINENRDYNNKTPVSNYEEKEKIRSLNNNARQFQNEFTLIENYEKNNNKFLVEIHKKFTLAVACILFTLVGAPLGILVRKGGITIASALSIAFFLIYYILLIWGEQLADRALLDPAIGSWMPNIVLFIVGIIILFLSDKKN
ncbi:MAG: YjgP/YjgQ family permease [Candidatus Marinimicrobia bacterium]|jgi:lipopolysaccharide export system permease protein|nr:LptF/LptG family permease [Gammaproteobacteria bacterium]MBT3727724.1 YjgP/YjgQ family permease [Candidatus Neomarinimicrobiota bacterium]MBT3944512.1 YjgP/YjgQ family permease [Candidatus Neomarinimicrobiota bacterium]MBT4111967.1 YjgP/YjgQ family permease [Candidatus Neomarinimicrobiota bacterium]MBT4926251.1 YjgP/YjgQ family permease [Candidatus Neomarinimicrobiota bacterium]